MPVKPKSVGIDIAPVMEGATRVCLLGTSPLVMNRVSEKAKRELLLPAGRRRSKADRAGVLKHEPLREYRDSVYKIRKSDNATRLCFPSPAFKGSLTTAALDLPGTRKTEIGRLVRVEGHSVDMFGVPQLFMAIVRNSDPGHTPDVRTRAILPAWACIITVSFIMPHLSQPAVMNLVAAAGVIAGIGDGRQEKGKLSFGQFRIVNQDDPAFLNVLRTGGAAAQDAALAEPECYDDDTAELISWFEGELATRVRSGAHVAPVDEDEDDDETKDQQ